MQYKWPQHFVSSTSLSTPTTQPLNTALVRARCADSAGHVHDYTVNWPLDNTSTVTQRNYINPKGTIHICEGNGGVPIALGGGHSDHNGHSGYTCGNTNAPYNRSCEAQCVADYCRVHRFDPAYGRWTTSNSSVLTYQHVPNDPAHFESGTETWHVTQSSHGPFGPSPPSPSPPPSPPLKSCAAEQGFDWNGTQVCQTNCDVSAKDSAACCAACSERPGCKVGVLVGSQCYLKTALEAQTKYARAGRTSCEPKYEKGKGGKRRGAGGRSVGRAEGAQ